MYHSVAHGIRRHGPSRIELATHSFRGPVYAFLFLIVPNFVVTGVYWWMLAAVLAIDLLITIVDFAIERRSRELLGGLPSGEYVLHMFMAMLFGAFVTALATATWPWIHEAARIEYAPADVPAVLRGVLALMAILVFASGVLDAVAAIRLQHAGESTKSPAG